MFCEPESETEPTPLLMVAEVALPVEVHESVAEPLYSTVLGLTQMSHIGGVSCTLTMIVVEQFALPPGPETVSV
jgi:hypothetical protein